MYAGGMPQHDLSYYPINSFSRSDDRELALILIY